MTTHLATKDKASSGPVRYYWKAACTCGPFGFLKEALPRNVTWDADEADCKRCRKTVAWIVAHDQHRKE